MKRGFINSKIRIDRKKLQFIGRIWAVLLIFSIMGMADLPPVKVLASSIALSRVAVGVIACMKATLMTIIGIWLFRYKKLWLNIIAIVIAVILCFLDFLNFATYELYGFGISNKLITILAQTTTEEVSEFIPGLLSNLLSLSARLSTWIAVIAAGATIFFSGKLISYKYIRTSVYTISCIGIILTGYYLCFLPHSKFDLFVSTRTIKTIYRTYSEHRQLRTIMAKLRSFPVINETKSTHLTTNIFLIIGESASRQHLHIYGYPLPTTPEADNIKDSLFIFTDALASSTSTALNLERILSFMPDSDDSDRWYEYPLLIDLMNKAGYHTSWISNQEQTGFWSNSSAAMVSNADNIKYIGSLSSEENLIQCYDEDLLPYIYKAAQDTAKNKLICAHLKGSHVTYSKRYPQEFDKFNSNDILSIKKPTWLSKSKAQTVAEYDNSILYTDNVVNGIIKKARELKDPSIVIYLSDHGEHVYDERDFYGRDTLYLEVPFFIYANAAFHERNAALVEKISRATDRPFSTGNLIHSLLTISGTQTPLYNGRLDVLSDTFAIRPRHTDGRLWGKDLKN